MGDDHPSLQEARQPTSTGAGHEDTPGQSGVIGIALAAVLTAALAQGSWQWFSTYVGVTLLAVIFSFYRLPTWRPGLGSAYARNLAAYALVVGLCVAITLAPMLQRWAWLFPMPETRDSCPELGRYEAIRRRPSSRTWLAVAAPPWFRRRHLRAISLLPTAWRTLRPSGCRCTGPGLRYWWVWAHGPLTEAGQEKRRPWPPPNLILLARTEQACKRDRAARSGGPGSRRRMTRQPTMARPGLPAPPPLLAHFQLGSSPSLLKSGSAQCRLLKSRSAHAL